MAECEWIILCDYAFAAQNGKLGMIGVFDLIGATSVPVTHNRASIAFSVLGEPGEQGTLKLKIIGPSGQIVAGIEQGYTLPESGSARGSYEMQNLTLPEFGRYAIEIDVGDIQPKTAWFSLRQRPSQRNSR